jgi:hypothetical protein
MHTPKLLKSPISRNLPSAWVRSSLAILAVALFGVQTPVAQTPPASPASHLSHKAVHAHTHPGAVHPKTPPAQATPAPVAPPAPELPHWPVNDRPAEAAVTWDSHGLRIEAANSSLRQILKDVSTATGAKVEGLGADERIFGAYGPGQARDVLSQLLQGCGYNVMMVGDIGQGTPRQIVLSSRHGDDTPDFASQSPASNSDDEDTDAEQEVQQSGAPAVPTRSPEQILHDSQERQQQKLLMRQQQNLQ